MIPPSRIIKQVQQIELAKSHEEQLFMILKTYMSLFPMMNATLSRYSAFGFLGEGIISMEGERLEYISEIRDDIRSIPIIYQAIQERKAHFCQGIDFLKMVSSRYQIASNIQAITVTPICNGSAVLGFICSTKFSDDTQLNPTLLHALTQFGHLVGQYMAGGTALQLKNRLSKRELEVMKRVSLGERSKEIADALDISELTINQYIQSSVKKLLAHNRTHAVSILLREGVLT
ncbi:response regulator transcription factor [Acinetobacter higginsii]|uniref:HTH luxR-type domain-containing protein n=1 Tax=Acinetobacter higginsii TaxID=70347 RepID=N9T9Y5_9GAMM|nr:LuxR C-terminal-related transcriptional regulator [Acinetobacter higginsii]ENX60275.1 hypothetical protein F902_00815 [Acinetobacter higginsii]MCH7316866.1 LuxR C-terminal-related transcriptional regulator [Acinetobacter higginsii]